MKPSSGTSETRRDAAAGQCETPRLIAHAGPGAARPDDRVAVLAALADAGRLLPAEGYNWPATRLRGQPCLARRDGSRAVGRCPAWCGREGRHEVHIRDVGSARSVYVQLVCTEGPAVPRRLCEPRVVLRYIQALGPGESADVWLQAGEAGQLAVIFAHLGHRELARLVAGAAVAAAAETGA
jgi:hypothetical protein